MYSTFLNDLHFIANNLVSKVKLCLEVEGTELLKL